MHFNIDQDSGTLISGWLVPDNPSAIPTVRISVEGRSDVTLSANVTRLDLKKLGQHSTGQVGFAINASVVPGLESLPEVEIRELTTDLLIHRRSKGLNRRLFLMTLGLWRSPFPLEKQIRTHFSLYYLEVDRHPYDTLFAVLNNQKALSIFAAGQPSLTRYEDLLRGQDFTVAALIRSPFEGLADRLLAAQRGQRTDDWPPPLAERLRETDLFEAPAVSALLETVTRYTDAFSNPYVRTLACRPEEEPARHHIAVALNNLAGFDLVGLSSRFGTFQGILSDMLRVDTLVGWGLDNGGDVTRLATCLAELPVARTLLNLDLALHDHVGRAIASTEASMGKDEC